MDPIDQFSGFPVDQSIVLFQDGHLVRLGTERLQEGLWIDWNFGIIGESNDGNMGFCRADLAM